MDYNEVKRQLDDSYEWEEEEYNERWQLAQKFINEMPYERGDIIRIDGVKYEIIETEYDDELNAFHTRAYQIYPEGTRSHKIYEIHYLDVQKVINAELVIKGNGKIHEDY